MKPKPVRGTIPPANMFIFLCAPPLPIPAELAHRYGTEVDGVDLSCREQYLDDKEFVEIFGMSKADFAKQPKWKQVSAKKTKELF